VVGIGVLGFAIEATYMGWMSRETAVHNWLRLF
jgi:hypothetical protein